MELTRNADVFTLDFGAGKNVFNADSLAELFDMFDKVEQAAPAALVTTGSGKDYCQGLDLEWISAQTSQVSGKLIADVHRLYLRMLELPVYTVAAVNGHAFGAGAMLAIAHDAAYMKTDRGWWCLPEAALGMPFTVGMSSLLTARLPQPHGLRAMVTANRYTGPEALAAGFITGALPGEELLAHAQAEAAAHAGVAGGFLIETRKAIYADAIVALRTIADEGLVWG